MSNKIDVVKFTFRKEWRALSDALNGKYEHEEFSTASDLVSYLSTQQASLIFSSLTEKDDLVQLATLVKIAKKTAKDTILKIVVVNFSGNKQYEKAIAKLGILDVVDPTINNKALRFKIDFYMKSLNGQVKNASNKAALNVKSIEGGKNQTEQKKTDAANWLAPMECEDDIWLLKKEADCKKILGRWLLRFMGPSPAVAQWVELKGKANAWKLELKAEDKETFLSGTGNWYFQGDQKPEFVWKENSWLVTGSSFELFYHQDGVKQTRAKLKDKILEVCKNSEYAKTKEQAILESCNKELVFKKEADKLAGAEEVDGDNGTDFLNNLEGKGSTDHLNGDPLEGKNDASMDQLNNDPMSGKNGGAEDLGGHYEGEGSTDQIDESGMEGPGADKHRAGAELGMKNTKNEHETHYKGHNEAEEFEASEDLMAAADKHRAGAELGMKNTKNEHQTHYKGHNEAEKFEEGELGKHQYHEDDLGGGYGGDSKTDHIPKFYNKDGTKPDRPLTPEEQAESDAYEGRSNTDKIQKHYGRGEAEASGKENPDKAKQAGKAGKARAGSADEPEFDEEMDSDPYAGKSNTDKLASHYGRKGSKKDSDLDDDFDEEVDPVAAMRAAKARAARADAEKSDGDLSGGTSTDKIDTHYGKGKKGLTEDDLFEDEDEGAPAVSERKKRAKTDSDLFDGEDDSKEDVFSRKLEKKVKEEFVEEVEEEDIYAKKERKNKAAAVESALDDDFYQKVKQEKRRRGGHRDETEKPESFEDSFSDDDMPMDTAAREKASRKNLPGLSDDNVVPISKAREAKQRAVEEELDPALKTMTEEAVVTAMIKQGTLEMSCVLDDYFDSSIIFISHSSGLNPEEPVFLDLNFRYMQKVTSLSLPGKVISVDLMDETMSYITVDIDSNSVISFESFMKLYKQRQENVDAFLKKVKGL